MTNKQRKQVRNAVRNTLGYRIGKFMNPPKDYVHNWHYIADDRSYSENKEITKDQAFLYGLSKANDLARKGNFESALASYHTLYDYAVKREQVKTIQRKQFQELPKRERANQILEAYGRVSDESNDDNEYYAEQRRLQSKVADLEHGDTNPLYDTKLVKKIRAGIKYTLKRAQGSDRKLMSGFDDFGNETLAGLEYALNGQRVA